jgi:hypothetical protein
MSKVFYHGSSEELDLETILTPQEDGYVQTIEDPNEDILEDMRPSDKISRHEAVFMVDDIDLIDAVGGYIDYVYSVEPEGKVEKSDLAWVTEMDMVDDMDTKREYAMNYWNGIPFHDDKMSAFEYRTTKAEVISLEEEN